MGHGREERQHLRHGENSDGCRCSSLASSSTPPSSALQCIAIVIHHHHHNLGAELPDPSLPLLGGDPSLNPATDGGLREDDQLPHHQEGHTTVAPPGNRLDGIGTAPPCAKQQVKKDTPWRRASSVRRWQTIPLS